MYSDFWAILKNIPFQVKTALATFWANFGKFGLLFISASGHAGCSYFWSGSVYLYVGIATLFIYTNRSYDKSRFKISLSVKLLFRVTDSFQYSITTLKCKMSLLQFKVCVKYIDQINSQLYFWPMQLFKSRSWSLENFFKFHSIRYVLWWLNNVLAMFSLRCELILRPIRLQHFQLKVFRTSAGISSGWHLAGIF